MGDNTIETDMVAWAERLAAELEEHVRDAEALQTQIKKKRAMLKSLRIYLGQSDVPPKHLRATFPEFFPPNTPARGGRKKGNRKIDIVVSAIQHLPKERFVLGDLLLQIRKQFPQSGISRKHLSSLMWKLSTTDEGKNLFRQTVPWSGGNMQAQYERRNGA